MPEQQPAFESWAIGEMLGHKKLAGFVTEQTIAGAALIRVDVPATPEDTRYGTTYQATAEYSKLIGVASVYAITPCDEITARRAAREIERCNDPIPVTLPAQRRLPTPAREEIVDTFDDDDDAYRCRNYAEIGGALTDMRCIRDAGHPADGDDDGHLYGS